MTTESTAAPRPKRILTGDRPTGRLHLGHLLGSLRNRVRLQREYETILIVADLHMLTTKPSAAAIEQITKNARDIVLDYLAAGIDPERATIYLQSAVPEVYELNTLLQNLVTVNRLARVPSLKDMARNASIDDESMPYGLLGYPVLQAADILLPRAELVPVGRDNLAHVEITRELARRFNSLYGQVFTEPEALLGEVPTLVGTDGKGKMSKSAGNAIFLSDDARALKQKVRGMFTDPTRVRADVPADPDNGNPVFVFHELFNDRPDEVAELKARYREGRVGDGEVKERLTAALTRYMTPLWARRARYERDPGLIDEVLYHGTRKVQAIARETMRDVRQAMGLDKAMKRMRRVVEKRERRARATASAGEP